MTKKEYHIDHASFADYLEKMVAIIPKVLKNVVNQPDTVSPNA